MSLQTVPEMTGLSAWVFSCPLTFERQPMVRTNSHTGADPKSLLLSFAINVITKHLLIIQK